MPALANAGFDRASVCTGCGAEIVHGATRRERSLIGVVFVIAAMLIAVALLRVFEIARGISALPSPKAEDGFLLFIGLITVVVIPSSWELVLRVYFGVPAVASTGVININR